MAPLVKWAGGKRQLLRDLTALLPPEIPFYCEPFVGGGALLFALQPPAALVNDINRELILMYEAVRDDVEAVIGALEGHRNDSAHFYEVRAWDRDGARFLALPPAQRAARLLYLNRTCYNGLYRVNSAGHFNTPFGRYKNPNIVNAPLLRAVSGYLRQADVAFSCRDFAQVLAEVPPGAFAYLDPPYDPVSETASFTGYARGGFGRADQLRLRACCDALDARGVRFMLSNSATPFIRELYAGYHLTLVRAGRAVNANAAGRGPVEEVVVRNYTG